MNKLFINAFKSSIKSRISPKSKVRLEKGYIATIKRLTRIQRRYKFYNILLKCILYFLILLVIIPPYILFMFKKFYSDIEKITKYVTTICAIIVGIGDFFIGMFGFSKKIFVCEQTKLRLANAGAKFLDFQGSKRYNGCRKLEDAVIPFLRKVNRIVQFSVIKYNGEITEKKSNSFISKGGDFIGIDPIDIELETKESEIKELKEEYELYSKIKKDGISIKESNIKTVLY